MFLVRPDSRLLVLLLIGLPLVGASRHYLGVVSNQAVAFQDSKEDDKKQISDKELFAEDDKDQQAVADQEKDDKEKDDESQNNETSDEQHEPLNAFDSFQTWSDEFENNVRNAITAEIQSQLDETNKQLDDRLEKYQKLQVEIEVLRMKFDHLLKQRREWNARYQAKDDEKDQVKQK